MLNYKKFSKKYENKTFLEEKDFHKHVPIVLSQYPKLNKIINKKYQEHIVGTTIKVGFWKKRAEFFPALFKNSNEKRFNPSKINKLSKSRRKNKISKQRKKRLYFKILNRKSALLFAAPGAGKTEGVIDPTIRANALSPSKPTMIITDPKGELAKNTKNWLENHGYKVLIINTIDFKNSDCLSPFRELKDILFEAFQFSPSVENAPLVIKDKKIEKINYASDEIAKIITSVVGASGTNDDKFWSSIGRDCLRFLLWVIIDDLELKYRKTKEIIKKYLSDLKINNANENIIKSYQNLIEEELSFNQNKSIEEIKLSDKLNLAIFEKIFIKLNFQSVNMLINSISINWIKSFYYDNFGLELDRNEMLADFIKEHPGISSWQPVFGRDEIAKNALTTISTSLSTIFSSPGLSKMSIFSTFKVRDLVDEKQSIALFIVSDNTNQSLREYISWLINYLMEYISSFALKLPNNKLKKPVFFIMEELGNLSWIPALVNIIQEGRGKEIFALLVFQTYQQYWSIYEKNKPGFASAINSLIFLMNREDKFAEESAKYFGKKKISEIIDQKVVKKEVLRITQNDLNSLRENEGIISFIELNIPYKTQFIPSWMLWNDRQSLIKVNNEDPLFLELGSYLEAVYSPAEKSGKNKLFDWLEWIKYIWVKDYEKIINLNILKDREEIKKLIKIFDEKLEISKKEIMKLEINNLNVFQVLEINEDNLIKIKNALKEIYKKFDFEDDDLEEKNLIEQEIKKIKKEYPKNLTNSKIWWNLELKQHQKLYQQSQDENIMKKINSIKNVFLDFEKSVIGNIQNINISFEKVKALALRWSKQIDSLEMSELIFFLELENRNTEEINELFDNAILILKRVNFQEKWFLDKVNLFKIKNSILDLLNSKQILE